MLQLCISFGSVFYSIVWQHCAYVLVRLRHKDLVRIRKRSCFAWKYLFWSTQTQRCPELSSKISYFWLKNVLSLKIWWCHAYKCLNAVLNGSHWPDHLAYVSLCWILMFLDQFSIYYDNTVLMVYLSSGSKYAQSVFGQTFLFHHKHNWKLSSRSLKVIRLSAANCRNARFMSLTQVENFPTSY